MPLETPTSIIYNSDGYEVSVTDGSSTTSKSAALLIAGSDGINNQFLYVNSNGSPVVVGSGVAGTPTGGVLTVQGVTGGKELPVTGTVTVTQGNNNNSLSEAWYTAITDGYSGPVAVQPALGQATANDPSLVVQISPNQQPIPTTLVPSTATPGSSIGKATGLSANVAVPVRYTTYTEQTTNGQRSLISSSANDSSAGTGARQVRITYLDQTGAGPFTETVTLNGTTAVNTVNTNICFIERMDVVSVGSGGFNAGTISLYTGTGATGTVIGTIGLGAVVSGQGDNQTFWAHHYVPTGTSVTGYAVYVGIIAAAGGGSSVTVIRARNPTVATSPFVVVSDFLNAAQGNSAARQYAASISLPGPLILVAVTTPANNNSTATCSFDWSQQ